MPKRQRPDLDAMRNVLEARTVSRRSLQAANTELFEKLRIVEQMPRTAGGVFDWDLLQPNTWLADLGAKSPGLQSLFQKALARSPMTD